MQETILGTASDVFTHWSVDFAGPFPKDVLQLFFNAQDAWVASASITQLLSFTIKEV